MFQFFECSFTLIFSYPQTDVVIICYNIMVQHSLKNVSAKWILEVKEHIPNRPILLGKSVKCQLIKIYVRCKKEYVRKGFLSQASLMIIDRLSTFSWNTKRQARRKSGWQQGLFHSRRTENCRWAQTCKIHRNFCIKGSWGINGIPKSLYFFAFVFFIR